MSKTRQRSWLILALLSFLLAACARDPEGDATLRYPEAGWLRYQNSEDAGYDQAALERARQKFETMDSAAVLVVHDGAVLAAWGDQESHYGIASIRKSIVSALYGMYFEEGIIDPDSTLADYDISDIAEPGFPDLTEQERSARILDLLKFRSGVYHATVNPLSQQPARGSHSPDTHWYYNNWDVGVLCTIIEQETGNTVFEEFERRLARPLGTEDFSPWDTAYNVIPQRSMHGNHNLKMSPRDMARFGLLYLRNGRWKERQLVSERFVEQSWTSHSQTGEPGRGYGYLWWTFETTASMPARFTAIGYRGRVIDVVPSEKLVFVHTVASNRRVPIDQSEALLRLVLAAKMGDPIPVPELIPETRPPFPEVVLEPETFRNYEGDYCKENGETVVSIESRELELILWLPTEFGPGFGYRMIPRSAEDFLVQDLKLDLSFEFDNEGRATQLFLGDGGFQRPETLKTYPGAEWVEGPVRLCANLGLE